MILQKVIGMIQTPLCCLHNSLIKEFRVRGNECFKRLVKLA